MSRTTILGPFLALSLGACCVGGGGGAAPAMPAGPSGPTAPGCPDNAASVVGTWTRAGFVEEYRADGTYLLNGTAGTIAWMRPGHAMLSVPAAGFAEEYDLGLSDSTTLLAINDLGQGTVYTRSSPTPSIPTECMDLRAAFVGTWLPTAGGPPETYRADGTYAAPGTGTWSFLAPGRLHLVGDNGVDSDYWIAMPSSDVMMAISMPPLSPQGVVYTRAP